DRARRDLAYFPAYTSTDAEVETLQRLYEEALAGADIVGLCIGSRPDCVPDAALDLLAGDRERGYEVWLEMGLQSAFDDTLARINRGHGFAAYADATARAQA
ncbi:TIGR01212 family radical SAM protein, partial [Aromatoleum toluclasticum]|nr:TIGR01212 family radical SAM protein [Aromatoleum toluclasticum]